MNVLPIILSLVIVITISTTALYEGMLDSKRFTNLYLKSHESDRAIQRMLTFDKYSEERKKLPVKKKQANHTGLEGSKTNSNDKKNATGDGRKNEANACAKLNLFPLFELEDPKQDIRYELCLKFFGTYYSKLPLIENRKQEKVFTNLLDSIIEAGKELSKKDELISLEKLSIKDPFLHKLFYQMLMGTNYYKYGRKSGYPALRSYISISDEKNEQKICFPHVSKEVLSVLTSHQASQDIFHAYHEHPRVNIEKFQEIMQKNGLTTEATVRKLLRFEHDKSFNKTENTYIAPDDDNSTEKGTQAYS